MEKSSLIVLISPNLTIAPVGSDIMGIEEKKSVV